MCMCGARATWQPACSSHARIRVRVGVRVRARGALVTPLHIVHEVDGLRRLQLAVGVVGTAAEEAVGVDLRRRARGGAG
eukprot:scaffold11134_cov27-Phaeocystis_antarctica.AAC.2